MGLLELREWLKTKLSDVSVLEDAEFEAKFTENSAPDSINIVESFRLVEAPKSTGSMLIKLISPGQGSSAYYPKEVLKRDGPKVFSKGTQMFMNHPTMEDMYNGVRDVKDIAAVMTEDAVYIEGEKAIAGEGLYARAEPTKKYREHLSNLYQISKEHDVQAFGVSINAAGTVKDGQVAGKPTKILQSFTAAESVDFVTRAGRGGQVAALFESAVRRFVTPKQEGKRMAEIDDNELNDLRESAKETTALKARLAEMESREKANNRKQAATDILNGKLKDTKLPAMAQNKIREAVMRDLPVKDDALDVAVFEASVVAEIKDWGELVKENTPTTPTVRGMGPSAPPAQSDADKNKLKEAHMRLGLDDKTAESLAAGRY